MTVYLIWTGEYSDADVVAVFSTQEKATAFVEAHNARLSGNAYADGRLDLWEEARIEPMEVDVKRAEPPAAQWRGIAHLRDTYVCVQPASDARPDGTDAFYTSKYGGGKSVHCYRATRELALRAAANYQRSFKAGTLLVEAYQWEVGW